MNDDDFYETPEGKSLLVKKIEKAKKAQKQIYVELEKIADDGRPDISCDLAFKIIEQLIKSLKSRSLYLEDLMLYLTINPDIVSRGKKLLHKRVEKVRNAIEILFEELNAINNGGKTNIVRSTIFDTIEGLMHDFQLWHREIVSVFREKKKIPLF